MTRNSATLGEISEAWIGRFAEGLPFLNTAKVAETFRDLSDSWNSLSPAGCPRWSALGDDCSPLEVSLAFEESDAVEFRLVIEPQAHPPAAVTYWESARRINQLLRDKYGCNYRGLDAIEHLYGPPISDAPMVAFHSVAFPRGGDPAFKLYLSPRSGGGPDHSRSAVEATFAALGYRKSWERLQSVLGETDEPFLICLDLEQGDSARFKYYVRVRRDSLKGILRRVALGGETSPDDVEKFLATLLRLQANPSPLRVILSFSYVSRSQEPLRVTTCVRPRDYFASDEQVRTGILECFHAFQIPAGPYEKAVRAAIALPLHQSEGRHTFVSLQRRRGRPRLTTYFSPCFFQDAHGLRNASATGNFWAPPPGG